MNKEQQIEEMAKAMCEHFDRAMVDQPCTKCRTYDKNCYTIHQAEALYNAGYRKVPDRAVDEITRLNNVEAELQELNIKYYNEAKDLRRELAEAKAENLRLSEKLTQVLLSIDTVKEMNAMCDIDDHIKQTVKEFAEKLKELLHNDYIKPSGFTDERCVFECIDELLKEYENE